MNDKGEEWSPIEDERKQTPAIGKGSPVELSDIRKIIGKHRGIRMRLNCG